MSKFLLMFPIVIFLLASGCSKDSDNSDGNPTAPGNHAPVIRTIHANPDTIFVYNSTNIDCVATDQDDDSLTYTWMLDYGRFYDHSIFEPEVEWVAPSNPGDYTINLIVSDGKDIAEGFVKIKVQ